MDRQRIGYKLKRNKNPRRNGATGGPIGRAVAEIMGIYLSKSTFLGHGRALCGMWKKKSEKSGSDCGA